ncbi:MAG: hypothetical protein ACK4RK_10855 [Gemmataceae bacterium]
MRPLRSPILCGLTWLLPLGFAATAPAADGVFARFRLEEPKEGTYFVRLGGYIHKTPWYLPRGVVPAGADQQGGPRVAAGEYTPWFDLKEFAGDRLHGRMQRAGGVAEFPNVTAEFVVDPPAARRTVVIELATAANEQAIVKRFRESYGGALTSFLVSPNLKEDADSLETASEMTERRLRWAREASGGQRMAPKQLIVQTSFWGPQRPELNLKEAEVLHLLGFNVVGNQRPEVREHYAFHIPGHTHAVQFGPAATRDSIDKLMQKHAAGQKEKLAPGMPFNFSDEIAARPPIGANEQALQHFQQWLAAKKIDPKILGVAQLSAVRPIETPVELKERLAANPAAARRIFYYTSRFRQEAGTQRIRWHTEAFHRYFPKGPITSTLVADHPYFAGSGLGMGMTPNPAWGNYPLALDWFDLARHKAVDLIGIEDWMGLQYMYGPNFTWEGFQLMGFQAAMFRSGSRGELPIIAWITPSDDTNLRLKSASALCQGAKHFFYWTYGPTATSTENYWSDLRGAYDGVVNITRQLAEAEPIIAPGTTRPTRVALLYSISADLWQPFGYVHMLERRATYLSLIHQQYLVDMLTEEDIEAGRLRDYDVLYATDPCVSDKAMAQIAAWVKAGGHLHGSCAAGSRNEFNEEVPGLAAVFGIEPVTQVQAQPGAYHVRGALNYMKYLDEIQLADASLRVPPTSLGVLGTKATLTPKGGAVIGKYQDGSPAVVRHTFGKGQSLLFGTCPGLTYIKEARFVPRELKEQWPASVRPVINAVANTSGAPRLVELSHPVVEAGVFDADKGTVLVLANFTYQPIAELTIRLPLPKAIQSARSLSKGPVKFELEKVNDARYPYRVTCTVPLGLNDIVVLE